MKNRRVPTISALSLVVAGTLVLSGCGAAVVEHAGSTSTTTATTTVASTGSDFWDSSSVHTISVDVDADTLASLLETYETSGEKEWVEADVVIDGVTYAHAGLKLNDATMQATALYKAESGGDYSYRGTDPDAYDDVFDQKAGALYDGELARLTQLFYEDGNATEILSAWSTTLKNGASDLVDSDTVNAETEDLAAAFDVASGSTGD